MPVYLDTSSNSVLSVAVCDRCNRKFPYVELMPDPNFPGMRVCQDDLDNFDPWRLPARQTENIALRFPRPDVSVATGPNGGNQIQTENGFQNGNSFFVSSNNNANAGQPGDLNLDSTYQFFPSSTIPTLYSVTPTSGSKVGGTPITINGTNFVNITNVTLGGVNMSYNIISPTQMTAITPAYSITGIVDLTVHSTFGVSTLYGAYTYTP